MRVLVLNAGSATLKSSVLDLPGLEPVVERTIEWAADADADERRRAVDAALGAAAQAGVSVTSIDAVGHRVVHGGARFIRPVRVDAAVEDAIDELADLAPLHNPLAAATLRAARTALPDVPHVAAFDTAFHAALPEVAFRYPVPPRWFDEWAIRRYGFHGLSVAWSARRAAELLERPVEELRVVVAHLGGGCSVTAVDGGRSVDTSMGLTPLEGLMMGTRAGSIDPGVVFRLLRQGVEAERIEDDLEHASGLLGVGGTSDVRELLAREARDDEHATLALALFVRRAAAGIAAAATALPALDAVVFTGGIGENAAPVRSRICERLATLRVPLPDPAPATRGDLVLSAPGASPAVLRVGSREDVVIAEATATATAAAGA